MVIVVLNRSRIVSASVDIRETHAKRSRAHRTAVTLQVSVLRASVCAQMDSRIRRAVNRSEISDTVALHTNVRDMELVIFVNAAVRVISAGEDLRATLMYVRVRP